jgi:RNA polymerase sigma-70 factor (ECF subfamily)
MRYAYRLTHGDADRAQEAVQHTFVKLCQQQPESISANLAGWLCAVCRNKVFDDLRLRQRQRQVPELPPIPSSEREPNEMAEQLEMTAVIDEVIEQLPPAQRNAIELWRTGMRYGEIAAQLEKEETSIRVAVHRAIASLRANPLVARCLGLESDSSRNSAGAAGLAFARMPSRAT